MTALTLWSPRPTVLRRASPRSEFLMGIFSRTRDIIAANMADLIERADDPARTIRLIILEMEDTLVEVRSSAARTIADQKEMRRHARRLSDLADGWAEKAQLAVSKDRDDLARAALVEKAKAADMAGELTAEAAQLDANLSSFEGDIAKLQAKLTDARARQSAIAGRIESAGNAIRLREAYGGEKTKDALARFEVLERRADALEGHADALALGAGRTLEDEFTALDEGDAIDWELARLKAGGGDAA